MDRASRSAAGRGSNSEFLRQPSSLSLQLRYSQVDLASASELVAYGAATLSVVITVDSLGSAVCFLPVLDYPRAKLLPRGRKSLSLAHQWCFTQGAFG